MTLSSNLPSAESTTLPADPFVCLGVPAQTTVAESASTPFATLLTEAGPSGASAPEIDNNFVAPDAVTPLPATPTPVIRWSAELLDFYSIDKSTAPVEEAAPQVDVAQTPTNPITYSGIRYVSNAPVQTLPSDPVESPVADCVPSVVQPQVQPQATPVAAVAQNSPSQAAPQPAPVQESKSRAAAPTRAKGQPQSPVEGDEVLDKPNNTDKTPEKPAAQDTALLVYQLVAGQWVVSQPVVQPSVQEQEPVQKGGSSVESGTDTIVEESPIITGETVSPDRQPPARSISQPVAGSERKSAQVQTVGEKRKSQVQKSTDADRAPKDFTNAFTSTIETEQPPEVTRSVVPAVVRSPRIESPKENQSPDVTGVVAAMAGSNQQVNLPPEKLNSAQRDTAIVPGDLPSPEAEKSISPRRQDPTVSENPKDLSSTDGSTPSPDSTKFSVRPDAMTFRTAADLKVQFQVQEKSAAPQPVGRAELSSGVIPPNEPEEKKTLTVDNKKVSGTTRNVGTSVANRDISMPYSAANKSSIAEFTTTPLMASSAGVQTGQTAETTPVSVPVAVQAPRLVHEIREIAERISTIDRNTVEVRFDFSESDRLSVRVEYRDGTVHTTFKTDSHQLRDAISHEWLAQSVSAESRPYRLAEPTFSTNSTKQQDLSSADNGSSHSRSFEQPANSHGSGSGFSHTGRRSSGSSSAPAAPKSAIRPETSRHLHTLA